MYKQDESVIVSKLGDNKKYAAKIKGVSGTGFIVEWVDRPKWSEFTHSVIVPACIKPTKLLNSLPSGYAVLRKNATPFILVGVDYSESHNEAVKEIFYHGKTMY